MKLHSSLATVSVIAAMSGNAFAETPLPQPPQDKPVLHAVVDLIDGSRIVGTPLEKSFAVTLSYANPTVPLEVIARCEIKHSPESATLFLQNGDHITGTLGIDSFPLDTIFGKISPKIVQIDRIAISLSYPEVASKDLVLWFPFDKDEGSTVADKSGQGNDGTIHGAEPATDRRGKERSAMRFNGSSAWIEAKNKVGEKLTQQITVSAWVKKTGPDNNWGRIVSGGSPVNSVYNMCIDTGSGRVLWRPILTGDELDAAAVLLPCDLTEWTMLTGTYDGQVTTLYVNGQKVGENRHAGTLATNTQSLAVGGENGAHEGANHASWFNGLLDEVRIYERALSATEVEMLFQHEK